MNNVSYTNILLDAPLEILLLIFGNLDASNLRTLALVSKHLHSAVQQKVLWPQYKNDLNEEALTNDQQLRYQETPRLVSFEVYQATLVEIEETNRSDEVDNYLEESSLMTQENTTRSDWPVLEIHRFVKEKGAAFVCEYLKMFALAQALIEKGHGGLAVHAEYNRPPIYRVFDDCDSEFESITLARALHTLSLASWSKPYSEPIRTIALWLAYTLTFDMGMSEPFIKFSDGLKIFYGAILNMMKADANLGMELLRELRTVDKGAFLVRMAIVSLDTEQFEMVLNNVSEIVLSSKDWDEDDKPDWYEPSWVVIDALKAEKYENILLLLNNCRTIREMGLGFVTDEVFAYARSPEFVDKLKEVQVRQDNAISSYLSGVQF